MTQLMEKEDKKYVTDAINARIDTYGTPVSLIQKELGMAYNTFKTRRVKHNWKKSEIALLKELNIL